jgi:hypothetical protein
VRGTLTIGGAGGLEVALREHQPWFAGSLTALSLAEVAQVIFTSLRSGVLHLSFAAPAGDAGQARARQRSLYFREGQLVFAASSEHSDRLGPVLWREGLIEWEMLAKSGTLVGPGRPLGQVLVDQGVISSAQLYAGMAAQVREILLGALLEAEGEFAFVEGFADQPNDIRLPERTRDLLLLGLKQVEESERLLAELGGRGVVLTFSGDVPADPDAYTIRLLDTVDGERTLVEVADESRLGLLQTLRRAAPLLAAGTLTATGGVDPAGALAGPDAEEEAGIEVEVEAPLAATLPGTPQQPGAPARSGGPFDTYRRIFRRVHGALAAARPGAEKRLDSYFERLPEKQRYLFKGVAFLPDGDIETNQVLTNVLEAGQLRGAGARARSLEALEALLSFTLFEVKNVLAKPDAEALLREVGKMQVGKA